MKEIFVIVWATYNFRKTSRFTGTLLVVGHHDYQDPCAHMKGEPCRPHHTCMILVTQSPIVGIATRYWISFKVRLKFCTQGFLSSKLHQESILRTCIGQLDTHLFAIIQSTFVYILYVRLEPNQLGTLLSS